MAGQWTENKFYERLLDIRRRDRKTFDGMSPATKTALAEYERAKRESFTSGRVEVERGGRFNQP